VKFTANVIGNALPALCVDIGDDDLRAFVGKATGNGLANTARTAGNERLLVCNLATWLSVLIATG